MFFFSKIPSRSEDQLERSSISFQLAKTLPQANLHWKRKTRALGWREKGEKKRKEKERRKGRRGVVYISSRGKGG